MAGTCQNFVAVDDFRNVYLKGLLNEIYDLANHVDGQIRHIENHKAEQTISIEHDMLRIENVLVDAIRNLMIRYKDAV